MDRVSPPPSFPVSLHTFYATRPLHFKEAKRRGCHQHSDHMKVVKLALMKKRFPDLLPHELSLHRQKSPRCGPLAPTDEHLHRQRRRAASQSPPPFRLANVSNAKQTIVGSSNAYGGSPYEAKREKDYAEHLESKRRRMGKDFKCPARVNDLLEPHKYLNAGNTMELFQD